MDQRIIRIWYCFAQFLTIPANIVFSLLLKLKINRPRDLRIEKGTLVVSNHQSKLDPFLISYHIGFKNWLNLVPIRYPVTHEYMNNGLVSYFIAILGGFNIGETPLERLKGLARIRDLLKKKYSVVIFPEGKINYTSDEVDDFKRGVEILFAKNYPVVFVRLANLNQVDKFQFWKTKRGSITYSQFYSASVPAQEKIDTMLNFYDITHTQHD